MKHKFIALSLMAALPAGACGDDAIVATVEKLVRPEFKMTCLVTTQKRPNKPLADSLRKEAAEKGAGFAVNHPELVEQFEKGEVITKRLKAQWTPSQDHWLEIVLNEKETAISGLRVFLRGALSEESEVLEWGEEVDGTPVPRKTSRTQYDEKGDWRSKEIWGFEELSFEGIDPERFRYVAPQR